MVLQQPPDQNQYHQDRLKDRHQNRWSYFMPTASSTISTLLQSHHQLTETRPLSSFAAIFKPAHNLSGIDKSLKYCPIFPSIHYIPIRVSTQWQKDQKYLFAYYLNLVTKQGPRGRFNNNKINKNLIIIITIFITTTVIILHLQELTNYLKNKNPGTPRTPQSMTSQFSAGLGLSLGRQVSSSGTISSAQAY